MSDLKVEKIETYKCHTFRITEDNRKNILEGGFIAILSVAESKKTKGSPFPESHQASVIFNGEEIPILLTEIHSLDSLKDEAVRIVEEKLKRT